jgi:phosphatidylinositol alpha-1,6-mannosyltransferase
MIPELDEESQLLLTIARMVPRKGHLRALGAFAAVAGEFPNAHWAFTGTGALRSTILEEAARLGVQDRVHGLGWVAEEQLCSLLSRSDVMLGLGEETDDDVEGLGLCFIEAGCTGTPSLVTRTGGVSEVVIDGETGILVEQGETDTIPQRLAHLLSDRAYRRRLGENARKLAREKFDAYRNIDRLIDFLTECYLSG